MNPLRMTDPAQQVAAVTPSDTTNLSNATRRLFIGTAGNVYIDAVGNGLNVPEVASATGTVDWSGWTTGDVEITIDGTALVISAAATPEDMADALVGAIEGSAPLDGVVTAVAVADLVTITSVVPGKFGNTLTLASDSVDVPVSGATLTGGVGGAGNYVKYKAPIGYLQVQATRVYATGTTATDIVAEW